MTDEISGSMLDRSYGSAADSGPKRLWVWIPPWEGCCVLKLDNEWKFAHLDIESNNFSFWENKDYHLLAYQATQVRGQKYFNIALVLQDEWLTIFTRPANTYTCPLKAYAIKNIRE